MCRCFKLLTHIGLLDINDVVESQMSFIERVVRAGKLDGTDSILLKNVFRALLLHTTSAMRFKEAGFLRRRGFLFPLSSCISIAAHTLSPSVEVLRLFSTFL